MCGHFDPTPHPTASATRVKVNGTLTGAWVQNGNAPSTSNGNLIVIFHSQECHNNQRVLGMAQPFRLCQEYKKTSPQCCQYEQALLVPARTYVATTFDRHQFH